MNPMMFKVMMGMEDARLTEHITMLEAHKSGATASAGISEGEQLLLDALYARLDVITQ